MTSKPSSLKLPICCAVFCVATISLSACQTRDSVKAYQSKSCAELSSFAQSDNLLGFDPAYSNGNSRPNDVLGTVFQSDDKNSETALRRNYKKKNCGQN